MIVNNDIVPIFPTSIDYENSDAIDWGSCSIFAFSTSSTVHFAFSYLNNLIRCYSYDFRPGNITCLKFHSVFRKLAIGDDSGRVILWDVDLKASFGSSMLYLNHGISCKNVQWSENSVISLYSNNRIVCYNHSPSAKTSSLINLSIVWNISLPICYSKLSINYFDDSIWYLLSNTAGSFSVFQSESIEEPPKAVLQQVSFPKNEKFVDIQWSFHMPGFIFVVFERELKIFDINLQLLFPLVTNKSSAYFSQMIQSRSDYRRIILLFANGTISFYESFDSLQYVIKRTIVTKSSINYILKCVQCPIYDDYILCLIPNIGIGLFSCNTYRMEKIASFFPTYISSFDGKGKFFAIGTSQGYLIFGDYTNQYRYFIDDSPILSVFYLFDCGIVFWINSKSVGYIDCENRNKSIINRGDFTKSRTFCTEFGAFMILYDEYSLSIFVNKQDYSQRYHKSIKFCAFDPDSTSQNGTVSILFTNSDFLVLKYNITHGLLKPHYYYSFSQFGDSPTSCAITGDLAYIVYINGSICLYNFLNQNTKMLSCKMNDVYSFHLLNSKSYIGITKNGVLFTGKQNVTQYPYKILSYSIIDKSFLMIQCQDNIVRVISIGDWTSLSKSSQLMAPPSIEKFVSSKVLNYSQSPIKWFRPEAREIWNILKDEPPLNLMFLYCAGRKNVYPEILCKIYQSINVLNQDTRIIKCFSMLFTNDFDSACKTLLNNIDESSLLQLNSALCGCIYASNCQPSSDFGAKMKHIGLNLFLKGDYRMGSIFFRIGRQDKSAFDYLYEARQIPLALDFVRSCLCESEKEEALIKFGIFYYNESKFFKSMLFFASAKQFHPVLHIATQLGMKADSYYILQHCLGTKILSEFPTKYAKSISNLPSLNDVISTIRNDYGKLIQKLHLENGIK